MSKKCESCNKESIKFGLKSTSIGNLCESCYNEYLGYFVEEGRGGVRKSFFIFFLTNIFFIIAVLTGTFEAEEITDIMSILLFYVLIMAVIGGVNLVKSGFQPVGKAEMRRHLYEGEIDYSGNVTVRGKGSYDTYSTDQWMKIASNIILFAFGLAITAGAGSIVFLINYISYKSKSKEYNKLLETQGIDVKTHVNPVKIIKQYKGPLAVKCINFEEDHTTSFKGVLMDHIGYLVHEGELFGAIGTRDESQNEFTAGTAYFIRLNKKNDKFEYIDNPSQLYETLYQKLWGDENSEPTNNGNFSEYTSRLSKKVLDLESEETSIIYGEEVEHGGYLVHNDELYGVIMSDDEQQNEFQVNCIYFIKVSKNTEDYEVVDINLDLYTTLYKKFDKLRK